MNASQEVRAQLIKHLNGEVAYQPVEQFVRKVTAEQAGIVPKELPYSIWQQFWHLKFTQADILDFSRNPDYQEPNWPDGYWPEQSAPASEEEWQHTIKEYLREREEFIALVNNPDNDLYTPFSHGDGQNLLNEALLVIGHTAYHSGEILVILRLLGLYH